MPTHSRNRWLRTAPAAAALALVALLAPAAQAAPTSAASATSPAAAAAAPTQVAAPTSWYLNISGQAQEQTNWCWAATGNSVAAHFGHGQYSQNQFCNMAFGRAIDSTCPNDQATLANDQNAFRQIGISQGSYVTGTLSYDTVVAEVAANRPVMTRIGWASGGGHMMVLTGYDTSASTVEYYDPWPSDSRFNTSTYSWYRSNSSFTWTHSLYRIGA